MPSSLGRINALKKSDYKCTADICFNKVDKVIISKEAIADHDDNWLNRQLEASDGHSWLFIFTYESPSDSKKEKILKDLGLT